ncbi:MAG: FtsH protease activity modulator HflK [Chloroflexi bacterium]|nr:FtsH protease activity modulator HflK [Chloroflexota bacterium]|tara:strand:+ start:973 stop:2001 length:1029 start_codon:yes stop_codon:yes gene_type:complete
MYRQEEPEINIDKLIARLKSMFGFLGKDGDGKGKGIGPTFLFGALSVILLLWLATGIFTVQPGEQAALKLLGQYSSTKGTGLQWWWPSPIGARDVVRIDEVRTIEVGIRGDTPVLSESIMITGDTNIVDVQLLVQYDIKNLKNYLYKVVSPDGSTLKDAIESSLRQVVGSGPIDDVLTDKKEDVQMATKGKLQSILDKYEAGIRIREVKLLNVFAPEQVKDAFDDVVRAREDKERIVNLAEAYKEDILPKARGQASRMLQEAEGTRQKSISEATGEAESFLAIQQEYEKAKDVTRKRLYLEAMEEILPGISKILGNPDDVILVNPESSKNIIPIPIDDTMGE